MNTNPLYVSVIIWAAIVIGLTMVVKGGYDFFMDWYRARKENRDFWKDWK